MGYTHDNPIDMVSVTCECSFSCDARVNISARHYLEVVTHKAYQIVKPRHYASQRHVIIERTPRYSVVAPVQFVKPQLQRTFSS